MRTRTPAATHSIPSRLTSERDATPNPATSSQQSLPNRTARSPTTPTVATQGPLRNPLRRRPLSFPRKSLLESILTNPSRNC
jgi:hypothetical protein